MGKNAALLGLFITIALVAAILSSHNVVAATISEVSVTDVLISDRSLSEQVYLKLTNNTDSSFDINLPNTARDISAGNASDSNNTLHIPLNCTNCSIEVSYVMDSAARSEPKDRFILERTIDMPQNPSLLIYQLYLPPGYVISNSTSDTPAVVPVPTNISTNGQTILVSWIDHNPSLPKLYRISYQGPESTETIADAISGEFSSWYSWVLAGVLLVLGIVGGVYLNRLWYEKKAPKPLPMFHKSLLSPDEQKVLEYLRSANANIDPINQRDIVRNLNWSKSKVSAILSNLSYKKIIEKEKIGRNFRVKLIKDMG